MPTEHKKICPLHKYFLQGIFPSVPNKTYVFIFFFLAAGKRTLFKMRR